MKLSFMFTDIGEKVKSEITGWFMTCRTFKSRRDQAVYPRSHAGLRFVQISGEYQLPSYQIPMRFK